MIHLLKLLRIQMNTKISYLLQGLGIMYNGLHSQQMESQSPFTSLPSGS